MKHYHGTPMGGTRDGVTRFLRGRFALIPFLRPEDAPTAFDVCRGVCLDNSAFTAWKQGVKIVWRDYYNFVDSWRLHPRFDFALIPDDIEGSEQDNSVLIGKWFKRFPMDYTGVPVFHLHESNGHLEYLVQHFPALAIGSSGQWKTPGTDAWHDRMAEVFDIICDEHGRPKRRTHGLRMLSPDIVERYPFYSADSTNVAQNKSLVRRFGMYAAPNDWQRAEAIAHRVESIVSPPIFEKQTQACFELLG